MFVDSHCHLDMLDCTPYDGKLTPYLAQAKANQIEHMLCVSVTLEAYPEMLQRVAEYPNVSVSVGVHPDYNEVREPTIEELVQLATEPKVVAIGETGLDYFRSEEAVHAQQQARFRVHIAAAKESNKPLIIHTRQAKQDTLQIMKEEQAATVGGVMHCFTEDEAMAKQAMAMNFYISFSGIVTFKSAKALQQLAKSIPLDRMLIETDAPYLAPVPHRGKKNQPAYVIHVAEYIAKLRGISVAEIGAVTSQNFYQLFGVSQ